MTSLNVAEYLGQLGSNQRKLQFCRQILAANPNFIPHSIFTFNFKHHKRSLNLKQFTQMMESVGMACNEKEVQLIFSYFQTDGKDYITCDEFVSSILPQTDPSLNKLLENRSENSFNLEYSLKYSLQKYFEQIIQNQVTLEVRCNFGFQLDPRQNFKNKRIESSVIKEFMRKNGKFPTETILLFITRQINKNKGEKRRHQIIKQYIFEYVQKINQNRDDLPVVTKKAQPSPISIPLSRKKISHPSQQQQKQQPTIEERTVLPLNKKFSGGSSDINWNCFSPQKNRKGQRQKITPIQSLTDVEQRIKRLMGQVSAEQDQILKRSKLSKFSVLNQKTQNKQQHHKRQPSSTQSWKDSSCQKSQPKSKSSKIQINFSSLTVPSAKSQENTNSQRFSEREKVRKRFNLNETSSPIKSTKRQIPIEFGKIQEESKEYCDSSRAKNKQQKSVQKIRERSSSRKAEDLSLYSRYNYLQHQKSKQKVKDRISFLKQLVGEKE